MSDPLKTLRGRIDALDRRLAGLLAERARLAQRIGAMKNGATYRPEREAQVLRGILRENRGPIPDAALARLFVEIMSACRALEDATRVASSSERHADMISTNRRASAASGIGPRFSRRMPRSTWASRSGR